MNTNPFPIGSQWRDAAVIIIVTNFDGTRLSLRHRDAAIGGHMGQNFWPRLVRV